MRRQIDLPPSGWAISTPVAITRDWQTMPWEDLIVRKDGNSPDLILHEVHCGLPLGKDVVHNAYFFCCFMC